MAQPLEVPEPVELLDFFGSGPTEAVPEDGYWCYEARDPNGVSLRLSFHRFERSLQTIISIGDRIVEQVSQEGAVRLRLMEDDAGRSLVGECELGDARSKVTIRIKPQILVTWAALVD